MTTPFVRARTLCITTALFFLLLLALALSQDDSLQVGTLTLTACEEVEAYCGWLERPLDPTGILSSETIEIAFEFYPQTESSKENLGTIVASEGGPGYATTGTRDSFLELFEPLLAQRNVLLMDNRGTGGSAALECNDLQLATTFTQDLIADCATQLGDTAYLYGSALAADDLAALLDALGLEKIDLYGDSYGTFFSQTFAGRHPEKLRSLVLDAAYPVINFSPWYPENADALRYAFETVCERAVTCEGSSLERLKDAAELLRTAPFSGIAFDGDGNEVEVEVNVQSLGYLMILATYGFNIYRELGAAVRALQEQDNVPLLRMVAENLPIVEEDVTAYSAALFVAVSCNDYTQIYDMASPIEERMLQRESAIAEQRELNADIYAPLTLDEYIGLSLDYSVLDMCLSWAVAPEAYPPAQPVGATARFTDAPALVLSGELDTITSPLSARQTAELFPNSHYVQIANSVHVTALGDLDDCASRIVRHFVETFELGDTSCAETISEVRTVPVFARLARDLVAATGLEGNQADDGTLKVVTAAALTVGDTLTRWWVNYDGDGVGLRGGTFSYVTADEDENLYHFELRRMTWTEDVVVTGVVDWNTSTDEVSARLLVASEGQRGTLTIAWLDRQAEATATISGRMNGQSVKATMPAP